MSYPDKTNLPIWCTLFLIASRYLGKKPLENGGTLSNLPPDTFRRKMFAARAIAGPHGQKLRETNDRLRTHNDRVKEKKRKGGPPHHSSHIYSEERKTTKNGHLSARRKGRSADSVRRRRVLTSFFRRAIGIHFQRLLQELSASRLSVPPWVRVLQVFIVIVIIAIIIIY